MKKVSPALRDPSSKVCSSRFPWRSEALNEARERFERAIMGGKCLQGVFFGKRKQQGRERGPQSRKIENRRVNRCHRRSNVKSKRTKLVLRRIHQQFKQITLGF